MKKTSLYILANLFLIIGLIPLAKNIFELKLLDGNPIFFILGGIWAMIAIIVIIAKQNIIEA